MSRKGKIIVSITGITLVLLILVGLTYAYFLTRIQGNTNSKSISVSMADLELVYGDGNGLITAELIEPGTTLTTKTFTVTNTGNATVEYGVFLEDLINTFERTDDLELTVTCQSSVNNKTCSGYIGNMLTQNDILLTNSIDEDEIQSYELTLEYIEAGENQSVDMNKELGAKIQIYGLNETIDLFGTIADASNGDYVEVNSVPKRSYLKDNKYKVVGLLPGEHTVKLYSSDGTEKYTQNITINIGNEESINGSAITVLKDTRNVLINISSSGISASLNPYEEGTLAYAIINSARNTLNGTTFRNTPLNKVGEEAPYLYNDGTLGSEKTYDYSYTRSSIASNIYITYGDTISYTTKYTITNQDESSVQAVLLSSNYEDIIGKYIVSSSGSTSSTPASVTNLNYVYYVVNATSNSITTVELSDGLSKNGKYITYGDSYEFDRSTGTYTIVNADGSPIQTIKYNEGYNNILVDKYIVNYGGSNSSTPDNAIGRSTIYKVTNNSTNLTIAYKTLEKSSLMTATESTLSVTPDDYGVSYYYRGDIDDNYVNFAGLCWRIVRIEGDGSVKLILEDKTRTCNHSSFTGNWADSTKINFGYDSTVTPNKPEFLNFSGGLADKLKTYQTTLNTKIANTYSNKGLSDYLKIDEWCYDDKINISEYIDSYLHEYYGAFYRITRQIKTSLKCSGTKLKKFSDNTDMYVGSLTADESVFAGGHFRTQAYYLVNNYQRSNSGFSFWTLSPGVVNYQYNSNYVYAVKSNGGVDELSYSTKVYYRPAITLKSGTTFVAGGVGTKSNPYVIN